MLDSNSINTQYVTREIMSSASLHSSTGTTYSFNPISGWAYDLREWTWRTCQLVYNYFILLVSLDMFSLPNQLICYFIPV